jgi:polysaccharide pyruvyl transferase WcaK-like protein
VLEWPAGSPRILVADAWLANAGDGAISLATQERLARLEPGAAILHAAYQGDMLADSYPELALVPPLAGLVGVTPEIPEMRGCESDAAERLVSEADVVLSQGGGFAMEHYDPLERLRAWEHVAELGVPLGFCAQSVGPFRAPRERRALRRAYGAAAVVGVREPDSARHVIELGAPPERVLVTADEVFSLSPEEGAAGPRAGLACVLSGHPQPLEDGSPAAPPRAPAALARLVSGLVRLAGGEHVTLLSTQQGLGAAGRGLEDDAELARAVVDAMPGAEAAHVRIAEGYLPPRRCAREIAAHRGLLSMRMHPAIFGLRAGIPTVLVNQAFKATSMFAMLGLGSVLAGSGDPLAALAQQIGRGQRWNLTLARRRAAGNDVAVRRLLAAAVPSAAAAHRGPFARR